MANVLTQIGKQAAKDTYNTAQVNDSVEDLTQWGKDVHKTTQDVTKEDTSKAELAKDVIGLGGDAINMTINKTPFDGLDPVPTEDIQQLVDYGTNVTPESSLTWQRIENELREDNSGNSSNENGYTGFHKKDPHNSMKEKADSYPNSMVENEYTGVMDADLLQKMQEETAWAKGKMFTEMTPEETRKYWDTVQKYNLEQFERNQNKNKSDDNKLDKDKPTDNPPQDTPKGDDGNKLNMDTPNLDNQPKDTPKGDDDKSALEKLLENAEDVGKKFLELVGLRDKDKDDKQPDNQSAKDTPNTDNKDSQAQDGKDTPNEKPAETPDNNGEQNGEQNGGDDNGAGAGAGGGIACNDELFFQAA